MPTCTPIYGLTYPICADPPCDVGETFCEFANQVEAELDRLDAVVDRTINTIPQFEVMVGPYTFVGTDRTVSFDTVNVDTDSMVNLSENSFAFPIKTSGRWFFYFHVSTNGNFAIQENIPATVVNTPSLGVITITQDYQDNGTNYPVSIDGSGFYRYPAANATLVSLVVNTAAGAILSATFGGYWMGDL